MAQMVSEEETREKKLEEKYAEAQERVQGIEQDVAHIKTQMQDVRAGQTALAKGESGDAVQRMSVQIQEAVGDLESQLEEIHSLPSLHDTVIIEADSESGTQRTGNRESGAALTASDSSTHISSNSLQSSTQDPGKESPAVAPVTPPIPPRPSVKELESSPSVGSEPAAESVQIEALPASVESAKEEAEETLASEGADPAESQAGPENRPVPAPGADAQDVNTAVGGDDNESQQEVASGAEAVEAEQPVAPETGNTAAGSAESDE